VHAQRRRTVPSCSDGVKSADSIVRQSAAYALGQYESNILVSGLFLGLSYNDIFVKRKSIFVNRYYCNEEAEKKPRNYKNDQNEEIRNLAKIELEKLQFKMQMIS
jgi:hypothetical protein